MLGVVRLENCEELDKPRRVMKYVLLWCSSGSLTLTIDQHDFELTGGDVVTITSGQVHFIKQKANAKGYVLEFTLDYFCKNDNDIELIFQNGLFCHFAMNEVIALEGSNVIEEQIGLIERELTHQPYQYLISIHSRIELILIEINRVKIGRGDEIWKPDALFLKFLEAIRDNFEKDYTLAEFAEILGTTELKLNEQAKMHTGKTAQNVIHGLVVSEAKRLLIYESLSVKEVAFTLGFKDPFYFSNFFKKHTSLSPKVFQDTFKYNR